MAKSTRAPANVPGLHPRRIAAISMPMSRTPCFPPRMRISRLRMAVLIRAHCAHLGAFHASSRRIFGSWQAHVDSSSQSVQCLKMKGRRKGSTKYWHVNCGPWWRSKSDSTALRAKGGLPNVHDAIATKFSPVRKGRRQTDRGRSALANRQESDAPCGWRRRNASSATIPVGGRLAGPAPNPRGRRRGHGRTIGPRSHVLRTADGGRTVPAGCGRNSS